MIALKRKNRQIKLEGIVLGLSILIMVSILAASNWKMLQKRRGFLAEIQSLEDQVEVLEKRNEELKRGISETGDKSYLEKEAVERFNLKPAGSQVVVVKDKTEEEKKHEEHKTFWQGLLEKIGIK